MTSLAKSCPDGSEANGRASRMLGRVGDTFTMAMYLPSIGDYLMLNRVIAFEFLRPKVPAIWLLAARIPRIRV
jgi:hypothetical protein